MTKIWMTVAAIGLSGMVTAQAPAPGGTPQFMPRTGAGERASALNRMLDTNHDGAATRAEVDAWAKSKGLPSEMVASMFADADRNHDGKITVAEQTADALRSFDEADTDHDGKMTAAERDAAERKFAQQMRAAPGTPAKR